MEKDKIIDLKKELQLQSQDFDRLLEQSGEVFFDDKSKHEQNITVDSLSDQYYLIWLSTNGQHIKTTAKKIIENLQWRIDVGVGKNDMIKEEDINKILGTKIVTLQGVNADGNGVLITRVGMHKPTLRTNETWSKYCVYCLEGIVRYMKKYGNPEGKIIEVHDLTGYGTANKDLIGASILVDILQKHYPGKLGKCYILNAPFLFWAIWEILQVLFTAETRSKIEFVYEEKGGLEVLKSVIPLSILPERYGGTAQDGDLAENIRGLQSS